mgnify:CR=1 FL=1
MVLVNLTKGFLGRGFESVEWWRMMTEKQVRIVDENVELKGIRI